LIDRTGCQNFTKI